jgi:phosphoribosylanthranilate isomerase
MNRTAAPLWIKICGLRSAADVAAAVAAGADAVGFVFHAASPRHLALQAAQVLAASVPRGIERVAVFLHPTQAELDAAIDAVQPDWVQTDAADLETLELHDGQRVLPVYRTDRALPARASLPQRYLLESGRSGTGERADWDAAARQARHREVVLAGGLDAANVGAAIAAVQPFGVDVSSGVEITRGVKDATMIMNFVNAARAMHARLASSSLE